MRWADYTHHGFWTHSVLWSEDSVLLGWCFAQNDGSVIWEMDDDSISGTCADRREAKLEVRKLAKLFLLESKKSS